MKDKKTTRPPLLFLESRAPHVRKLPKPLRVLLATARSSECPKEARALPESTFQAHSGLASKVGGSGTQNLHGVRSHALWSFT
jgi:hypothetical protein